MTLETPPPPEPDPSHRLHDPAGETEEPEPWHVDITVPHMARVYDYLLGGNDNFAVDRRHAEFVCDALPGGIEAARANIRANREFLGDAVRYLATEVGMRQFLDIGTGIPNKDNVHTVAQEAAADARVVYVDYDPVVLAHAHELLRSAPQGAAAFINADLRDPEKILTGAARTLDFGQPVAVMLVGVLHYLADGEEPYRIVAQLLDALAPGSHLVVSHLAADIQQEMVELADRHNQPKPAETVRLRDHSEVLGFFERLEVLEPGVVPVNRWRPPTSPARPGSPSALLAFDGSAVPIPIYGAVGRKSDTSGP